jgi:hypothetical protein
MAARKQRVRQADPGTRCILPGYNPGYLLPPTGFYLLISTTSQ